jgi:hypothetical protein
LVYADYVNILGGNVPTVKGNAEVLVVASKETGLEINVEKHKYMFRCRDQNAGRSHGMKTVNNLFGRVNHSKHF